MTYLHSYHSSRLWVDWNRCGQAAVATLLDHHELDPYNLGKSVYDESDRCYHWRDGEIVDRISNDFPPDHLFGLFGTTPERLVTALESYGLNANYESSRDESRGREIWKGAKRSVDAGYPIVTIMDRGKLGERPFAAHWGVVYQVEDGTVHLANTKGLDTVPEEQFLSAFKCRFMSPRFNHCAVFAQLGGR